ncbi:radical SAM protein [Infirmifilum sp. NZ]|uniref:radical SAM protein n=1 Tax=Infirmifilum sp. NZ TaxID=2926850 RepID=UPI002798B00C|nr:radical SAM protein [Infirmifilum sp. NZ]UNQ73369.1 radical SAM protein [Infirmifilum sp. NZ]
MCLECLRANPDEALRIAEEAHIRARRLLGLPSPPSGDGGECVACGRRCRMGDGEVGFCGLVRNSHGRLVRSYPLEAPGFAYLDPHPTNCVAAWFCPGATGAGYPRYSVSPGGPERGYYNLAVAYGACNLNCLFCQNWDCRRADLGLRLPLMKLVERARDPRVTCVCFFGGDPGPLAYHALKAAEEALKAREGQVFRVCWETNGLWNRKLLLRAAEISYVSGGVLKFDLKAWTPAVYRALTFADPKPVYENFAEVAGRFDLRRDPPFLCASTLLVPGYVDSYEMEMIASFLASIDRDIPYVLLAFHPDFLMSDLPVTSKRQAHEALEAARRAGLRKVWLGNAWLLRD